MRPAGIAGDAETLIPVGHAHAASNNGIGRLPEYERTRDVIDQRPSSTADRHRLNVVRAIDVRREEIQWLWPGILPLGKMAVLEGDPGTGKSALVAEVAACITRGRRLPGGEETVPRDVILVGAEDGWGDTVVPRLDAAGADVRRVHLLDEASTGRLVRFPDDTDLLEKLVRDTGAGLVVIDTLSNHLNPKFDSHRDPAVREALNPLVRMATRAQVSVCGIRHLGKASDNRRAITAGLGSIGISGLARTVLLVAHDPDSPGTNHRLLAVSKQSLARVAQTLTFAIDCAGGGSSCVRWTGTSKRSAEELVLMKPGMRMEKFFSAKALVETELARGPVLVADLLAEGEARGISQTTLGRAKRDLGVRLFRPTFGGPVQWALPILLIAMNLSASACPVSIARLRR